MNGSANIDRERERYLDDWAKMMVTIWHDKMAQSGVGISEKPGRKTAGFGFEGADRGGTLRYSSGDLRASFRAELIKQSGGDVAKITHTFLYYGIFLDGGVFPGIGKVGQNYLSNPKREAKPWRDLSWGVSKQRLRAKMLELTGKDFFYSMQSILVGNTIRNK